MSMIYEMNRVTLHEAMNARPEAPVIPDRIKIAPTRIDKVRSGMTAALRRVADGIEPAPIPEASMVGGADADA
jgi:hypothetical protein